VDKILAQKASFDRNNAVIYNKICFKNVTKCSMLGRHESWTTNITPSNKRSTDFEQISWHNIPDIKTLLHVTNKNKSHKPSLNDS
jgi:hypothetical protein